MSQQNEPSRRVVLMTDEERAIVDLIGLPFPPDGAEPLNPGEGRLLTEAGAKCAHVSDPDAARTP